LAEGRKIVVGRRLRFRGIFQKYFLALFPAVAMPLTANDISEAWFGCRDQRARLDQLLQVEAMAATARGGTPRRTVSDDCQSEYPFPCRRDKARCLS
jgi:hypothetical protein